MSKLLASLAVGLLAVTGTTAIRDPSSDLFPAAYSQQYKDQVVVRAVPKSQDQVEYLNKLADHGIDFWNDAVVLDQPSDLRLTTAELESFELPYEILIDDLQSVIMKEAEQIRSFKNRPVTLSDDKARSDWFKTYHTYAEVQTFVKDLTTKYKLEYMPSIGKSFEGRDIPAYIFGSNATDARTVYIQGGIHAREWVSHSTALFVSEKFLIARDSTATDALTTRAKEVLKTVRFVVAPQINPDGYEYSRTKDRMWRKNRNSNNGNRCKGVDLNRNWDNHWGQGGSSTNACSDTYMGVKPFSEPETIVASNFANQMKTRFGKVHAGVDLHSYGQLLLRPYGWCMPSQEVPPNETDLKNLGQKMKDTIKAYSGMTYTSEHAAELYIATGGADDWMYASLTNSNMAFTFELRDTGRYGFSLPADQLIPTGEEIFRAFLDLAEFVKSKPY
eukprot:TRINITY_DN2623_c0_g1::TRINITY_DN2623_c0_g1_i1::g.25957::m.25957 TRINITY_DN2623_c0_g1::TRINITY_DN2623_c0_g1_i1::g.25957  ORF type:complete len:457 (+),score=181.89,sp/P00731/CBPA1_RAT/34.70/7e-69,Peptidase_M14/PF00246.19/8.6e-67,Propep_M14/PF02244.11/1.3e-09,Propep_M14/PF02244.11/1.7e+03 TRINITY_DN2623_c0_g1_i1:37-1371(+)